MEKTNRKTKCVEFEVSRVEPWSKVIDMARAGKGLTLDQLTERTQISDNTLRKMSNIFQGKTSSFIIASMGLGLELSITFEDVPLAFDSMESLFEVLTTIRNSRGLTRNKLSSMCDISPATVKSIETTGGNIGSFISLLKAHCAHLNLKLYYEI